MKYPIKKTVKKIAKKKSASHLGKTTRTTTVIPGIMSTPEVLSMPVRESLPAAVVASKYYVDI